MNFYGVNIGGLGELCTLVAILILTYYSAAALIVVCVTLRHKCGATLAVVQPQ